MSFSLLASCLNGLQVGIQAVEALFPKPAEFVDPVRDPLELRSLEPARP